MTSKSKKKARKAKLKIKECAGCTHNFTVTGYFHHLRQTTKPACVAVRDAEAQHNSNDSSSSSSPTSTSSSAAVGPFEGDFYGDYDPADFNDYDEYSDLKSNSDHDMEGEGSGSGEEGAIDEEDEEDELQEELEEEMDALHYQDEEGWEPPGGHPDDMEVDDNFPDADRQNEPSNSDSSDPSHSRTSRLCAQERLRAKTYVDRFPSVVAGARTQQTRELTAYDEVESEEDNKYFPFQSQIDWEVAHWAKMRGPTSTALTELLRIKKLPELLGLSFRTSRQLNQIVDEHLSSGRPRFIRREIKVVGEYFEVFYRDVLQCVRALFGDPEFTGVLAFTPECHYADADRTVRVYFDMHTGRWWWDTQKEIEKRKPGATIIPIIISSDKTQLTVFGNKTAYPVYLTIGNLPKTIRRKPSRRGQVLLAYLPTSRLEHITNKAARRRVTANLFHACLSTILKPLIKAGVHGIKIKSGDGVVRRGHPVFAMYIGDYPEQLLVTCCKNGTCPKCDIPPSELGDTTTPDRPLRDLNKIFAALAEAGSTATAFSKACRNAGIKPIAHPFWKDLPYVNVFLSITPDILHQVHQGVIKHVLSWLKQAYGADELDARCRRLPPNHQIRLFLKGITTLQRVTGKEHAHMCRFLLGLIATLPLRGGFSSVRLVRAVRALLDFSYIAQYPAHTSDTLQQLRGALQRFHANKMIFVDLDIREHFHIPKLHSFDHYLNSIKAFGTTDNYDTQHTERLHIDFAKEAYRATNHKDEFPQMTVWLERREKVSRHAAYIQWRLDRDDRPAPPQLDNRNPPSISPSPTRLAPVLPDPHPDPLPPPTFTRMKLAKWPTIKALRFDAAIKSYGAISLRDALARFIIRYRSPHLAPHQVNHEVRSFIPRFNTIAVFHRIKFLLEDAQDLGIMDSVHDAVHARPERRDSHGRKAIVSAESD
ncbi:hypothetical protein GSI_14238 [Ganoderma sinense ZZ0214-1]|uniref:Uncharacterized protein n=1 Tax=Ganoderma sinense ZZ0214-1 TaxID=1077348 RepID=A0A2G8RSK9_9APHY|nr:hypothetical protein GSI_14238 [Ganoderma sinense ZZ0214-1]